MDNHRRLAVIGMAFRFPGACEPGEYWRNSLTRTSHIRQFTDQDFAAAGIPAEVYRAPGFSGASGLIPGIGGFDARFFGMSGREADITDPQHRLFLECCYHALENAGYAQVPAGRRVGVFASAGYRLYSLHSYLARNVDPAGGGPDGWLEAKQAQVGNYADFIGTRVAHRLGLTGPALTVQTACSSSLVALHLARLSLLAGDADLALAGAAAVHIPQVVGYQHVKGSTLSPRGVLRAFDSAADGTVGGNGVAAVVLKRLDLALADGDTVYAVILGTGVTNDGNTEGSFAAPSAAGQRDAVLRALDTAEVTAESIGYLEAHGTGTYKGDPIEFEALTAAYRQQTTQAGYCALGTVKPNIGHLDTCAGLAGLIRAVLVLRHAVIPPLTGFRNPNPALALDTSPFYIPAEAVPWPGTAWPRRAGVHSVGMGGTNAHVIVEEAPAPGLAPHPSGRRPVPGILPLSARDGRALTEHARAYRDHLRQRPRTRLADLVTTTALGRPHLRHRLAVRGHSPRELADALDRYLAGPAAHPAGGPESSRGPGPSPRPHRPGFLFTGQASQYRGMARDLYDRFPVVRDVLTQCDACGRAIGTGPLLALLLDEAGSAPPVWETDTAQPALFAFQVALARLWRDLGVTPELVAGHSIGEYAALCAAGALSVADGLRLTALRGRFMQQHTVPGRMVAVLADRDTADEILAAVPGTELSVVNSGRQHVLACPERACGEVCRYLDTHAIPYQVLPVTRAFHSVLVEPALDRLREAARAAQVQPIGLPFISGISGEVHQPGWIPDADYFADHARKPVRFDAVLRRVGDSDCSILVEIGPSATLTTLARQALPHLPAVATARRGHELDALWTAVGRLYSGGAAIDWDALLDGPRGRRIPLPPYPFQHPLHWVGPSAAPATVSAADPGPGPAETVREPEEATMTDDLTARIAEQAARHLGWAPEEVGPDDLFVELGADSLQLINLTREIEGEYEVKITLRELLEDAGSARRTAELIASRRSAGPPVPGPGAEPSPAGPQEPGPGAAPQTAGPESAPQTAGPGAAPPAPAAGPEPGVAGYASREALDDLARQVRQLADTQAQILAQFSQLVTLFGAGNGKVAR